MATTPNKDGQDQHGQDQHILRPGEILSTETTAKIRPGVPSANPLYVPVP